MKMRIRSLHLVVLVMMVACGATLRAQWVQTSGITGVSVYSFASSGDTLFAGSSTGMFRSVDSGGNWSVINAGLTGHDVRPVVFNGATLFAGTDRGVFRSTNRGASWKGVNSGLTNFTIQTLVVKGSDLFAGTFRGTFRSINNGTSWVKAGFADVSVTALAVIGESLFAASSGNVFRSTDNGANWNVVGAGSTDSNVQVLAVSGTTLFAGSQYGLGETDGRIFRSANNGDNWTPVRPDVMRTAVHALTVSDTNLFAATYGGVFHSTDNGDSWTDLELKNVSPYAVGIYGDYVLAGTYVQGVWRRLRPGLVTASYDGPAPAGATASRTILAYPNPVSASVTLRYTLDGRAPVSITIHDALGRVAATPIAGEIQEGGNHEIPFDTRNLAPGVYSCHLRAGGGEVSTKLVVVR